MAFPVPNLKNAQWPESNSPEGMYASAQITISKSANHKG